MGSMNTMINRANMAMQGEQVLTTYDWEFEFQNWGPALYQPAELVYFTRAKSITGLNPLPQVNLIEINLRGYTLLQPGLVQTKPQDITINFQDFEDMTIRIWLWDWLLKMNSLTSTASYRREDLFVDLNIYQLNSSQQRVFKYAYQNCLPNTPSEAVDLTEQKDKLGDVSMTIASEFMLPTPLNVPGS